MDRRIGLSGRDRRADGRVAPPQPAFLGDRRGRLRTHRRRARRGSSHATLRGIAPHPRFHPAARGLGFHFEGYPRGPRGDFTERPASRLHGPQGRGPESSLGPGPDRLRRATALRHRGSGAPVLVADGKYIGFVADRALKKIEVNGGPVFRLAEATESRGGTWNREGVILYSPDARGPVYRIPAAGGKPVVATVFGPKDSTHRYPRFLPDGRHFLYLARRSGAGAGVDPEIRIGALDSKEWKAVLNVASSAVCASGYLLYVREGALVAQRFDAGRLAVEGEPVVVAPDLLMDERFSRGVFSASDDGVLAYQTGKGSTASVLRWIDRGGQVLGTVGEPAEYFDGGTPEISPDGTRAAVSILDLRTGSSDIWLTDLASGTRSRFTAGGGDKFRSTWSPDGRRIAYSLSGGNHPGDDVVIRDVAGAGERVVATDPLEYQAPTGFSPDGRFLLYEKSKGQRNDLLALPLDGDGASRPVA